MPEQSPAFPRLRTADDAPRSGGASLPGGTSAARPKRNTLFLVAAVILAVAAWGWFDVRARGQVDPQNPGLHKTDFTVYTAAGAAFFDGRDPYSVTNPRGWGYLYPPLFAILVAPLSALSEPNQVFVWFGISVLMCLGCYFECARVCRAVLPAKWYIADRDPSNVRATLPALQLLGPLPLAIALAALAAALLPALNCLQRGQVSVAKLYLLLLGLRLWIDARGAAQAVAAGCAWSAAIVLKITPLVPVGIVLFQAAASLWYSAHRGWEARRFVGLTCGLSVGLALYLLIVPSLFVGWRANLQHLGTWWTTIALRAESTANEDFAGDSTSKKNQSFSNGVRRLGNWISYQFAGGVYDDDPRKLPAGSARPIMESVLVDGLLWVGRLAALALALAVAWRAARANDPLAQAASFSLACVATLLVFPIARAHYFVLWLPAAALVPAWLTHAGRVRAAWWLAIMPAVLTIANYAWLNGVGRLGLLGIGTTVWFVAAAVEMLRPETAADEAIVPLPQRDTQVPSLRRRAA